MKEEVVKAGVEGVAQGQAAVLETEMGKAYDAGFSEGVASVPSTDDGINQGTVDAAVAAQKAEDDAKMAEAQAAHAQAMSDLQTDFDALKLDDETKTQAVADVQNRIMQVQAAFDQIKALLLPS